MIKIGNYYTRLDLLSEYIKLYVKYITEDYIPCSTLDENGNLIMSLVDRSSFDNIISELTRMEYNK